LAQTFGVLGLALAFSISSIINMLLLYVFLNFKIKTIDNNKIFNSLIKICVFSFASGSVTYAVLYYLSLVMTTDTFISIFTQGFVAGIFGLLSYLVLAIVFKLDEIAIVRTKLKKVLLLFKNGKNT
jgi:putative peptidoglycan lipid II flippase